VTQTEEFVMRTTYQLRFWQLLILMLLPILTLTSVAHAEELSGTVSAASVSLHKDPNLSSPVVGTFAQGTAVTVEGRSRDNSLVYIGAGTGPDKFNGWVSASDVAINGDINVLPIWDNGQGDENRAGEFAGPAPSSNGIVTNGVMRVTRDIKAGADECYRTVASITQGTPVKILARNDAGTWLFIWADAGDGWVPTSSVETSIDIGGLNVWTDHFVGDACQSPPQFDARICGRPGGATMASTTRWTDIFETADPDSTTGRAYTPDVEVTIIGRDFWGCWVSVSGGGDAGWVPINSLSERGVLDLPILLDNSDGCSIADGQVACPDA
jgi:hypothetical protein